MPSQREPRSRLQIDVRHDQERPELSLLRAVRRSFASVRWVVEVRLDRRRRAPQPTGDLRDRQTLRLPIVASKRDPAPTLNDTIGHRARDVRRHGRDRTAADWCSRLATPLAQFPSSRTPTSSLRCGHLEQTRCHAVREIGRCGLNARRTAKACHPRRRLTRSLPHPATSRTARSRVSSKDSSACSCEQQSASASAGRSISLGHPASSQASRRTLRAECVDPSLVRHRGRRIMKVVVWL